MADGFDSHTVSSSEFSNTNVQADSLSFTEKPNSVKMKDEICIAENSYYFTENQEFEVQDNTHEPKVTDFVDESVKKKEEAVEGKNFNMEENLVGSIDDGAVRCSLKIEVIDDTAMIDISQVGKSCSVDKKIKGFDGKSGRNRKKKNANHQVGKEMVASKVKGRNTEEAKEKNVPVSDGCKRNGGEEKRVYCRKELETLRFVGMEEQKKMWVEVYCGLGDTVQKEYDGLLDSNTQKHIRLSRRHLGKEKRVYCRKELETLRFVGMEEQKKMWVEVYFGLGDTVQKEYDGLLDSNTQKHIRLSRRHLGKENTPVISGNDHSEHLDDQEGNIDTRNSPLAFPLSRDDGVSYEGENNVYEESDDSDDDYSSIQRPAFRVTGEPDFDSGPPEDGLEYLRRVRWEALRLPKVKVAAVQGSKLNKEQTSYMPQIPDIAKCPEHLLPLKEWEEVFLADFSELRLALSRLEANVGTSSQLHSANIVSDKFDGLMSGEDEPSLSNAGDDPALENPIPKSPSDRPTLSVILRMDAVARVSMLRTRITAVQSMSALTRTDCLWVFALCAAVDTPVDADTCAALRSLLRKCANLRAEKSKLDDEVVMLSMLVTITGRYFGQSEQ